MPRNRKIQSTNPVATDPEVLGGEPVFSGTRVPLRTLFEYLEADYSLAEFLTCFPSVSRDAACTVLARSERALLRRSAA